MTTTMTMTMTMQDHIRRAVEMSGSQAKLAEAAGCSQQYVSLLIRGEGRISAEMALAFERATGCAVSRYDLRPDIFGDAPIQRVAE